MPFYSDAANPDLLDKVPLDARHILDVGCGTGALGAMLKRRNPALRVYGIEQDPEVAAVAAQRIDEVAVVDVEADPLPFGDVRFDCIIYGDVLEHLRDPWTLLRQQAATLRETGVVLICMPNVEHWSFAERLLRGTWDYEPQGLFDRTHLRWFNLETTRQAIEAAGLAPRDVSARIFDLPQAQEFAHAMRPALEALGIDPQAYVRRAAPLQHVWRARAREAPTLYVMSTMLPPVGGVSHVRVVEPMAALAADPSVITRIVQASEALPKLSDSPRIFVFHRPLLAGAEGLAAVRAVIAQGYLVVCEFDDHPDFIPVLQRPDVHNFSAVHAVQTSTEPLADVLRRDNPEVAVFPNAVYELPEPRNFATPGRIKLFFGGINREEDWPEWMPALNAVAAMAGERLHFEVVADRGFFDALETPHKNFTPLCDYPTYKALLAGSDISFMPLADNAFNRSKSDLKFIEAAAHRVVALASPVVYASSIEDGRTGVVFHDAQALQQKLVRLIATPEIGRGIGDAARRYVFEHRMLAYQVARRRDWYLSLWERREELHQALLARMPELAAAEMPVA
jgi:SAM-dependent methyltransferase